MYNDKIAEYLVESATVRVETALSELFGVRKGLSESGRYSPTLMEAYEKLWGSYEALCRASGREVKSERRVVFLEA